MLLWLVGLVATFVTGIITALIVYARWNYGILEKMKGVPVVKPSFFMGSEPNMHKKVLHEEDLMYFKRFGSIWGFYEGRDPHLYICDPELIRLIFVKDFDHFHSKRLLEFGHPLMNEMMDVQNIEKWKTIRNLLTPTLSTGRIKSMSGQMCEAISELIDYMKENYMPSGIVNVKQIYRALTTDIIARCAFGTKLHAVQDPNNIFLKNVGKLNNDNESMSFLLPLTFVFPYLSIFSPFVPAEVLEFFQGVLEKIMKSRRRENIAQNDFVDLLNSMIDKLLSPDLQRLKITDTTVMAQALLFLLAAFDTTATTLTMLSYRLALNPEEQKKLIQEVDQLLQRHNGKINSEICNELVYMESCIYETLRMCPPLGRLERVCQKDWHHAESKLEIKKGMVVQVSNWAVHNNPVYYPEPEKFKPDRFMPENKHKLTPYTFMAFGQGPHNCIGMRFGLLEIKLTMANILRYFTFELCDDTVLNFKPGRTFLVQYEDVKLRIVQRK